MLRFDFPNSQRPRIRGKPFKLFSDELPVIDFEKQHLIEKIFGNNDTKSIEALRKRQGDDREKRYVDGREFDSHSLPAIGGPDWDKLSGSDRQSIKSDSRLHGLKADIPQLQSKIRERLGIKPTQAEQDSANFFHLPTHKKRLKNMPKPDEYKKLVNWPRLPSQQIVTHMEMQQNLLNFKEKEGAFKDLHETKDFAFNSLKDSHISHSRDKNKHGLQYQYPKVDFHSVQPRRRKDDKKETEVSIPTPRKLSKSKRDAVLKAGTVSFKGEDIRQDTKQAVSILKKIRDTNEGTKPTDIPSQLAGPDINEHKKTCETQTDNTDSTILVHCDIPRKLLTSKESMFNTYVGDIHTREPKSLKKVNFHETVDETSSGDEILLNGIYTTSDATGLPTENADETLKQSIKTKHEENELSLSKSDGLRPKLVSTYVLSKQDIDQSLRKRVLQDQTSKKHRMQNMMKHFRKIRGIQNVPSTINLNTKNKSMAVTHLHDRPKGKIMKENDMIDHSGHSGELSQTTSVTPRSEKDFSKSVSVPLPSKLDMSKSQSLNEDIETCVQIRKHHKVLKHHKIRKHSKAGLHADNENAHNHINADEYHMADNDEIDRSMTGTELIKAYRLWNRRRKKYTGGLRTIEEPTTAVDYFSNVSHKKLSAFSKMSFGLDNDEVTSENT